VFVWGVLLVVCVCVSVSGVLFYVGVCVCDLLIFLHDCLSADPGPGPSFGVSIGCLSGLGALWDCVPHVCGGGVAVPAAVCRWGLCPCYRGVGRCLSGVNNHHQSSSAGRVNLNRRASVVVSMKAHAAGYQRERWLEGVHARDHFDY